MTAGPATDPGTLRADISREIERVAVQAGAKTMVGDPASAEVDRIKELQSVLAALPQRQTFSLRWAMAIGVVCLIGASLALTIHVPRTRVQFDIVTSSVIIQVADKFNWAGDWRVEPAQVRLQNFTNFDLPPEYGTAESLARGTSLEMNVTDGAVVMRQLMIERGGWLTIAGHETGATEIAAQGAPFSGSLDVYGTVAGHGGLSPGLSLPNAQFDSDTPPGRFGFAYDGRGRLPAALHAWPTDTLRLRRIEVSALSFFEESADQEQDATFASQILSGTLTMTDTGEHIALAPGVALRLTDARGLVAVLKVKHKDVQVKFEGTAGDVTLGNRNFARSLKPTVLEWLLHQQTVGFFWAAITFLWGIAWSTRRLFSGN
jgi:hypothetical protein